MMCNIIMFSIVFCSAAGRLIFLIAINRENPTINLFSAIYSYLNKNVELGLNFKPNSTFLFKL